MMSGNVSSPVSSAFPALLEGRQWDNYSDSLSGTTSLIHLRLIAPNPTGNRVCESVIFLAFRLKFLLKQER